MRLPTVVPKQNHKTVPVLAAEFQADPATVMCFRVSFPHDINNVRFVLLVSASDPARYIDRLPRLCWLQSDGTHSARVNPFKNALI